MPGRIRIERHGPRADLVFDHPERRNAVTADMWRALSAAALELEADASVRVVVLRGEGELAFVSGADISQFEAERSGQSAFAYNAENDIAFDALAAIGKPVLASIHGFCIGGGCAIALQADLRYCADDAVFAIPAARLGLGYAAKGLATLERIVGLPQAKELFLTARRFDAQEALALGLVNRVLPKAGLDAFVAEVVGQIADNAPLTLRAAKAAFADAGRPESAREPERVEAAIRACFESDDYAEGVRAFMAKRRPVFQGR
ncbi:MAG: enoyl-CoA hydratase/isomerase family protein [Deltaproteobacteria bacterium]|nr:enoyl-CoA hydratase/isomerase family protein [Deltaproteobacteria bacterium]